MKFGKQEGTQLKLPSKKNPVFLFRSSTRPRVKTEQVDTHKNAWHVPAANVRYGLILPCGEALRPGFPSLNHVTHLARLEPRGIKVFQQASRGHSLIMYIGTHCTNSPYMQKNANAKITDLCQEMLGLMIAVGWPHCYGAKVVEISSRSERAYFKPIADKEKLNTIILYSNTRDVYLTGKSNDQKLAKFWVCSCLQPRTKKLNFEIKLKKKETMSFFQASFTNLVYLSGLTHDKNGQKMTRMLVLLYKGLNPYFLKKAFVNPENNPVIVGISQRDLWSFSLSSRIKS